QLANAGREVPGVERRQCRMLLLADGSCERLQSVGPLQVARSKAHGRVAGNRVHDHGRRAAVERGCGMKTLMQLLDDMALERSWTESNFRHYQSVVRHLQDWRGEILHANDFHRDWVNQYLV